MIMLEYTDIQFNCVLKKKKSFRPDHDFTLATQVQTQAQESFINEKHKRKRKRSNKH